MNALIDRLHRETESLKEALRQTVLERETLRAELGLAHERIGQLLRATEAFTSAGMPVNADAQAWSAAEFLARAAARELNRKEVAK